MTTLVISYSRVDRTLVRAVVALLRSGMHGIERAVFWDGDLEPGTRWRDELQRAIDEAPQLFVFWCDHSSRSSEVRHEFQYALDRGKRVIPVLLDDTPLIQELAPIHGIDLRQAVRHESLAMVEKAVVSEQKTVDLGPVVRHHDSEGASKRALTPSPLSLAIIGVASSLATMVILGWYFLARRRTTGPPNVPNGIPGETGLSPHSLVGWLVVVVVACLVVLGVLLVRKFRRDARDRQETKVTRYSVPPQPPRPAETTLRPPELIRGDREAIRAAFAAFLDLAEQ